MSTPAGFTTVTPYITVDDGVGYCCFLVAGFGAEEIGRHVDGGRMVNAMLRIGNTVVMVSDGTPDWPATVTSYYLFVADADAAMAKAVAAGGVEVAPVGDKTYGDRQGGLRDPAGNTWWISQRLTDAPYY